MMRCVIVLTVISLLWASVLAGEAPLKSQPSRVPSGCKAAEGAQAEPYTKSDWAKAVVHEKTGIEFVFIPAGEFTMGTPSNEVGRTADEGPAHKVRISKPFYLGKYEVTQEQWTKIMGKNPSGFIGGDHPIYKGHRAYTLPPEVTEATMEKRPVEQTSWDDCKVFLEKAGGLRLPTEAEWEYACRAGTTGPYNCGDTISIDKVNFNGKPRQWEKGSFPPGRGSPIPVGVFAPNAWGLYDMHGNIYEYCCDRYAPDYYSKSPAEDPQGPAEGRLVVIRGGCWGSYAIACRSGKRYYVGPSERNFGMGLRAALEAK